MDQNFFYFIFENYLAQTSAKMYLKLPTCIHVQNVHLYRLVYNLCYLLHVAQSDMHA